MAWHTGVQSAGRSSSHDDRVPAAAAAAMAWRASVAAGSRGVADGSWQPWRGTRQPWQPWRGVPDGSWQPWRGRWELAAVAETLNPLADGSWQPWQMAAGLCLPDTRIHSVDD